MAKGNKQKQANGSHLGSEATLWATADKPPGNLDAIEYKHACLGVSFRTDLHPDLEAISFWPIRRSTMSDRGDGNLRRDVRWKFGMSRMDNANYAWIQHLIHQLSLVGATGFVITNCATELNRIEFKPPLI